MRICLQIVYLLLINRTFLFLFSMLLLYNCSRVTFPAKNNLIIYIYRFYFCLVLFRLNALVWFLFSIFFTCFFFFFCFVSFKKLKEEKWEKIHVQLFVKHFIGLNWIEFWEPYNLVVNMWHLLDRDRNEIQSKIEKKKNGN